jgi:hypothetical protein
MATDSRWISVDNIIKSAMIDFGETTPVMKNRFMSWIIRGVNELGYDVFKRFKEVLLKVDSSTYTALLPNDYLQQVRVGLINTNGEYLPFTYNPNIVFDVEVPACHCDCGCTSEICETITEENVEQTDVVIATPVVQCDYSVTLLFSQWENAVGVKCGNPVFPLFVVSITVGGFTSTINQSFATVNLYSAFLASYIIVGMPYTLVLNDGADYSCATTVSHYTDYPMTIVSYVKNGVTVLDGTIFADQAALTAYMLTLGWTLNNLAPNPSTYVIANSNFTWGVFNIESQTTAHQQAVVLNSSCSSTTVSQTYVNTCQTCVAENGEITKQCCVWGSVAISEYDYEIEIPAGRDGGFAFPLTDGVITINGTNTSIASMVGIAALTTYMEGLGFYVTSLEPLVFRKTGSTDVYGTLSSVLQEITLSFTQANHITYEVVKKCNVEHICVAEVVPECGCIVVTDAIVDVLNSNSILQNQAYNRYKRGGSLLQTYATAGNVLGYYNVNKENNIMYFNTGMPHRAVYLQYYSANEVDSGDFLVPVQAQETLIAYLDYKSKWSKSNVPLYEKQRAEKYWYNEKTKLKARLNPILMSEIQDILRTAPIRP